MVDAVGGIDVQGAHLGGSEALAYVSQGTANPAEYRDRLARQQTAIRALLDKTAADGLLGDPLKLFRLLDSLSKAVSVDETLTSAGMDGLATADAWPAQLDDPVRGVPGPRDRSRGRADRRLP